jgi:PAS domain S-box-containing protein
VNRDREKAEGKTAALPRANEALGDGRRVEKELCDEREWFRVTLSSIGDAVIATDTASHITFINPVACKLTGWAESDALGQPLEQVFRIVTETTRAAAESPVARALREGVVVGLANHTVLIRKDGGERPIDDSAAPICDSAGQLKGVVLVFRDVSERRRAELAHARLAAIVESSDDAIIGKDLEGMVTAWNPGAEKLYGYSRAEMMGKSVSLLIPPDHPDEFPGIMARLRRGERVPTYEAERMRKDGTRLHVALTISPVKDHLGTVTGASAIARDITERKRLEQELRDQHEWFRVTLGSIGDGVIATDTSGRLTFLNPVASALTGWDVEAALGQPLEKVFPIINEITRAPVENPVARVLREGVVVGLANHTVLTGKDGTERPIDDSAAPIRTDAGEMRGVVLVFRDVSERRRAELDHARLAALVGSSDDAIIGKDLEGIVTDWNSGAEKLYGYSEAEMIGKSVSILIPPEHTDEFPGIMARLRRGESVPTYEAERVRKDGARLQVALTISPIKNAYGEVVGASAIARDISELHHVAERMRSVVDHVVDGIITINQHGIIESFNVAAERLFGYTGAETIGQNVKMLMPEPYHSEHDGYVHNYLSTGQAKIIGIGREVVGRRKDGSTFPMDLAVSAFAVHGRRYFTGIVRDITARKQAEDALRQSEQRFAAELEAITRLHALSTRLLSANNLTKALDDVLENAIVTSGADFGNIQLYNPQIGALEIVAQRGFRQDFLDHFRTVRIDEGSACAQAMQSGQRIIIEDVNLDPAYQRHRAIAGAAGYRAVQSTPLKSRDGRILGMLSTHFRRPHRVSDRDQRLLDLYADHAVDLIERLRFEQALKDADRRKDEFLAMLAHELRNPLAPILNAAQVIRVVPPNDHRMSWARDIIDRQVQHMSRLVDDLLDVSRITTGKIELKLAPINLASAVARAIETSRPLIDARKHRLEVHLADVPLRIRADETRLAQVLANLLNNAAKFTEEGGQIRLSAKQEDSAIIIRVRDTGVGIAPDMLPRVFDLFSQADRSLDRSQGGLGIGLSLVKSLVELHGGSVEAHSDGLGKGTEFVVRLPPLARPPSHPSDETLPPAAAGLRRKLLVVDDNADAADSLALLLRMSGHDVEVAYSADQALQLAGESRPEIVFLDIGLPGMDGYEVARRLRRGPGLAPLKLVAVTGYGQEEDRRLSQQAGFDRHLTKPVSPADLHDVLNEPAIAPVD